MNRDKEKVDATATSCEQVNGSDVAPDDPRVVQALDEYLAAIDQGLAIDRQKFIEQHPDIATALTKCLAGLDFVARTAPQIGHAIAAGHERGGSQCGEAQPGAPLGDFLLKREIGRGGMGVVYEAVQISLERKVALKILPFAAALDGKQLQRFKNEAQAAAHLHHTNIVPVFGIGCERGVHFYAMQFIEGQTLAAVIDDLRQQAGLAAPIHRWVAPRGLRSPMSFFPATGPDPRRRIRNLLNLIGLRQPARPPRPLSSALRPPRRHRPSDQRAARHFYTRSRASASKLPRPWSMPTSWASCTATSSPATCSSTPAANCGSPTSALRTCRGTPT